VEYYNNILCVEAGWLIEDSGVLTKNVYNHLVVRNQLKVARRGCLNTPALVEYDSIPERFRKLIKEKRGDIESQTARNGIEDQIIDDAEARKYYRDYRLDDGRSIPVDTIKEYCANASILTALKEISTNRAAKRRSMGGNKTGIWDKLSEAVNNLDKCRYPHTLPTNVRRLQDKFNTYHNGGYESLIHSGFCNKNTEKISDNAKLWLLAQWANKVSVIPSIKQLTEKYNQEADAKGWHKVTADKTIHNFIYREDIQELWWGHRYGELKAKEKFAVQQKTLMPTMRDSLWYSDGTKLNYYYLTEDNKVETCQVYEVMDAYSEMLLGYHISKTEDYEAQFMAYKMALQVSGQKPYEIRYDNQGGHKKLESSNFLGNVSRLSIHTSPYNGKSKTIESAFGRFQSEFLKRDWYFTGQNITTKRDESKSNMEFILANKVNLPSLQEVKDRYKLRRDEWEAAPHHKTGISKTEMYRNSFNPMATKIDMMDMVELFWIERKDQVTCSAFGISFTEKKVKYDYLVYKQEGKPNVEWMRKNIDKKFTIRFDPNDTSLIYLYEKTASGLRFVTAAETKVTIHRNIQEQEESEATYIKGLEIDNKDNRIKTRDRMDAILEEHGLLPEQNGLISPKIKGVEKRKKGSKEGEIGKHQKKVSYADINEELTGTSMFDLI
jgi:hypothetical protein